MAFEKIYIGKATQVVATVDGKKSKLDILRVNLPWKGLEDHVFEVKGQQYLGFEVARLKSPDKYDRTHTCYVSQRVKETEPEMAMEPETEKKSRRKK